MTWLSEALAYQRRINDIRIMRLESDCGTLLGLYAHLLLWLDAVERLNHPYTRED